jgi:peroxiredoxin/predicted negative regulator of RcsB-dependent stress response
MLITLLLIFLLLNPAHAISIPLGGDAPEFSLKSIENKTISLNKYRGKIVVLIYWRTGQERSIRALRDGQDVFMSYGKKGVVVIGLTAESDKVDVIKKIIDENNIQFPVVLDPDRQVYGNYGIRVYPTTVLIDKEGKLVYDLPGHAVTYKNALEGHLKYLLGEIDEKTMEEMVSPHRQRKDESELLALRRYNLALKFTEARLIDQAIDAVEESIAAKPDYVKSHILFGFLLLEQKKADKAIEEFETALRLDPLSHDAKTGLGGALILKGEIDRAIDVLNEALIANPYPQMTNYELGRAYELKGEKDKAIEMYKKAMEKMIRKKILPSLISTCQ